MLIVSCITANAPPCILISADAPEAALIQVHTYVMTVLVTAAGHKWSFVQAACEEAAACRQCAMCMFNNDTGSASLREGA